MDRRNTLLTLCLKTVSALLLSAETLIIAKLIDHIISGIAVSQGRAILCDTVLLALFWLVNRAILFMCGILHARLHPPVTAQLPSYMLVK